MQKWSVVYSDPFPFVCGTGFLLIVNLVSVLSVFVVSWCSAFVHDCACLMMIKHSFDSLPLGKRSACMCRRSWKLPVRGLCM